MHRYTKTESGQFNTQTQGVSNINVIRKIPSKVELRVYLKNMIDFDNLGDDSTGRKIGCSIYPIYNFICRKYFNQFLQEGPVDTFMDPAALYVYNRVIELFDCLTDEQVKSVLKISKTYPEFLYGIKSADGKENYFQNSYTDVLEIDQLNGAVKFECFKSELVELVDQSKSLSGICREIVFKESNEYIIRQLGHFPYCIYKIENNEFVYKATLDLLYDWTTELIEYLETKDIHFFV